MSEQTRRRLHAHHGGDHFHDLMVGSFESRFDGAFWSFWSEHVVPHHDDAPAYADFGCGPGLMLREWRRRWPRATLHGVEIQPYMLQTAKQVADEVGGTIHDADLHTVTLPLPDASLDAVLSAVVIHEMREPIGMLREIRRLLRSSGRLVVMDWVRVPLAQYLARWDDDPFDPNATHERRADRMDHFMEHNEYTREDLRWIVERCGFAIEHAVDRGDGQFVWLVGRPI